MPEHSTIQSADCHEPKNITTSTTADAGKVITPDSTTSGTSTLRKLLATELDTTGGSEGEVLAVVSGVPSWIDTGGNLFGAMHFRGNTVDSSISVTSTPTLVTGANLATPGTLWTSSVTDSITFSNTSNNEKLTVPTTGTYEVTLNVSVQGSVASAKDYRFGFAINGSASGTLARVRDTLSTSSDWLAMSVSDYVDLTANDDVQIYVENLTDAANILIGEASMTCVLLKVS